MVDLSRFDSQLQRQFWPTKPLQQRTIRLDEDAPPFAAAKIVAMIAYPLERDWNMEGNAGRFGQALIASLYRISRYAGVIERWPNWVSELKIQTIKSRILKGERNFIRNMKVLSLLDVALARQVEAEAFSSGYKSAHRVKYSADLSEEIHEISFVEMQNGDFGLFSVFLENPKNSLRATILDHREAFGLGTGDAELAYKRIHGRIVKPFLAVLPFGWALNKVIAEKRKIAHQRDVSVSEVLVSQCEWVDTFGSELIEAELFSLVALRQLKMPMCSCRFAQPNWKPSSEF
jgi:hypothetical protein